MRCCAATNPPKSFDLRLRFGENLLTGVQSFRQIFGTSTSLEEDVLNLASAVYATDLGFKRSEREGFVRDIELTIYIRNLHAFAHVRENLEETLYALTQDNWTLSFEREQGPPEPLSTWPTEKGTTLLFSGGLDSFCAASEFVRNGVPVSLVSHITYNQVVGNAQARLHSCLEKFQGAPIPRIAVRVSGRSTGEFPFPRDKDREDTQRTRSFLFLAIACVVARRTGHNRIVAIAENGQMAINLPLTAARVGPFSTHTAHPEFIALAEGIFKALLSHPFTFENPYLYTTKAEVLGRLPGPLLEVIPEAVSCWRASRVRSYTHCGECVPCLVRRIATEERGVHIQEYARDLFNEDISSLDANDRGKRNLIELMEFICRFQQFDPNATSEIVSKFPELVNPYLDLDRAIHLYHRYSEEALRVFSRYPNLSSLL